MMRHGTDMILLPFAWLCTLPTFFVTGKLVNRTIDDTGGVSGPKAPHSLESINYQGNWGDRCGSVCDTGVNSSLAYNHTVHDSTSTSPDNIDSVTIQFSGSAIYLFGIEANVVDGITTRSNLTFQIDGEPAGTRIHLPNTTRIISYGVPIYTNSSLSYGDHSVTVSQAAPSTDEKDHTLLLFDYAIYTFDDEAKLPSSSDPVLSATQTVTTSTSSVQTSASSGTPDTQHHHKWPVGAIVGMVVGTQALLVAGVILCWRRRQRNQRLVIETINSVEQASRSSPGPNGGPVIPQSLGPAPPYPNSPHQRVPPAYDSIVQRILGRIPSVSTRRNQHRQQRPDSEHLATSESLLAPTQVKMEK